MLLAATCYSKSDKTQGFSGSYRSRKYMVCGMFNDCKGDAGFRGGCLQHHLIIERTYNLRWFLLSSHISFQSIPFQLLTFTCSTNVIAVIIIMMSVIMMSVIMMSVIMVVIVVTEVVLVPVFLGEQTPLLMLISLIWPEMKIFKIKKDY